MRVYAVKPARKGTTITLNRVSIFYSATSCLFFLFISLSFLHSSFFPLSLPFLSLSPCLLWSIDVVVSVRLAISFSYFILKVCRLCHILARKPLYLGLALRWMELAIPLFPIHEFSSTFLLRSRCRYCGLAVVDVYQTRSFLYTRAIVSHRPHKRTDIKPHKDNNRDRCFPSLSLSLLLFGARCIRRPSVHSLVRKVSCAEVKFVYREAQIGKIRRAECMPNASVKRENAFLNAFLHTDPHTYTYTDTPHAHIHIYMYIV